MKTGLLWARDESQKIEYTVKIVYNERKGPSIFVGYD